MTTITATSTTARLLGALLTALAASMLVFLLLWVGPDPSRLLASESDIDPAAIAQLQDQYGLNQPWYTQYLDWLGGMASGDWGTSMRTNAPAADLIGERLPVTIGMTLTATLLSVLISIPLAMFMAQRPRSRADTTLAGGAIFMAALPTFLLALILQWGALLLKDTLGVTIVHTSGPARESGLIELMQRYTLPIATLTAVQVAGWMRYQRGLLLEVIGNDYVTAARARGLTERVIQIHHVLRASLVPIITLVVIDIGAVIGGTLIVETVFGIPGTARLLLDSVQARDTVVVLNLVMLGSLAIVLTNTVGDVLSSRIDPRIRHASDST
jgi:peptide/nickel transport system permease protein